MAVAKKTVGNPNFKKGMRSPNPRGRPKGTGRPISPLRKTFNDSQKNEALAQEILAKVLRGEKVGKEQWDATKFLLGFLISANRAAQQDEAHRAALLREREVEDTEVGGEEVEETPKKEAPKFQLEIVRDHDFVFEGQDKEALASRGYATSEEEDG